MSGFWDLKTVSGRTPYACFTCLYSVLLLQLNRDGNAVKQTIYHKTVPLDCSRTNGFWDLTTVSGSIFYAGSICLYLVMLMQPNRNKNVINPTIYHKIPPFQLVADEWFLRSENGFWKNFLCLLYLLVFCIAASTKPWRKRCQVNDLSQDPSLSTARGWMVFEIWKRFVEELLMPVLPAYISWCWCNQTATKT